MTLPTAHRSRIRSMAEGATTAGALMQRKPFSVDLTSWMLLDKVFRSIVLPGSLGVACILCWLMLLAGASWWLAAPVSVVSIPLLTWFLSGVLLLLLKRYAGGSDPKIGWRRRSGH
jgi:hypothetical protein